MQGHHEKVEGHSKKISGAGNCAPPLFLLPAPRTLLNVELF